MTDESQNDPTDPAGVPTEPVSVPADATAGTGDQGPPPWQPPSKPPRSGVLVPVWALATVAGLLVFGLGLLGGWALASHHDDSRSAISPRDLRQLVPSGGQNGPSNNGGNGSGSTSGATAYLGVVPKNSTDPAGAAIDQVAPSSPASRAGLSSGDVITAVDTNAVRNAAQLTQRVHAHKIGDKVSVTYTRDGNSKTVAVTLARRPALGQIPVPDTTPQSEF